MTKTQLKKLIREVIDEAMPIRKPPGIPQDPSMARKFATDSTGAASFLQTIPTEDKVDNGFRIELFNYIQNLYNTNAGKKPSRLEFTVDSGLSKNVESVTDSNKHKMKYNAPYILYVIGRYFGYSVRYEGGVYKVDYEGKRLTDMNNLERDGRAFRKKVSGSKV